MEGNALNHDKSLGVIANDTLKDNGFKIGDTLTIEGSLEEKGNFFVKKVKGKEIRDINRSN